MTSRERLTIRFDGYPRELSLKEFSDAQIQIARRNAELNLKKKLPVDPRTEFPSFTIYRNGEEVGGG